MSKAKQPTQKMIDVGRVGRNRFEVPLDVVTQATAILGRRGSGKTNTACRFVEGVIAEGQQAIVLDPLDVWWGLKSSRSGKSAGLDVLLVGDARKPHTDLPLEKGDGKAIADFLVDERLPCIVSTAHLSKSANRVFSADFLERFYYRKSDPGHDTPCLLSIDEASLVIPQKMLEPDQARCIGAVEQCVRQGRSRGIGVILIDQRPASVNKDVLTQVELMITHQLTSPHDRKPVREWILANDTGDREKEFMGSLAGLATGEAWFWSPAWLRCFDRVKVLMRDTFDSSATPKVGEKKATAGKVAQFDLGAIKERLGASIERARAQDPKVLNKRIVALEKELKAAAATAAEPAGTDPAEVQEQVDRAVAAAVDDAIAARDAEWRGRVMDWGRDRLEEIAASVKQARDGLGLAGAEILNARPDVPDVRVPAKPARRPRQRAVGALTLTPVPSAMPKRSTPNSTPGTAANINAPKQAILNTLAWFGSVGVHQVSRSNVAAVAGVSPTSSGFEKNLSTLRTMGLIDYPSQGLLTLSEVGRGVAQAPTAPAGLEELHDAWLRSKSLSRPMAHLLTIVLKEYPEAICREDLAEEAGVSPTSSGFEKNVSRLSSLGLVRYPEPGWVEATELLFPPGLKGGGQ